MIETLYGTDQLVVSPGAKTFFLALVIGLGFGFALERAGFGSSRKLAGIFYLRDMTVLKVMFTALITGMLGLSLVVALGWIDLESQVYLLPTRYGAQIVGDLLQHVQTRPGLTQTGQRQAVARDHGPAPDRQRQQPDHPQWYLVEDG